MLIRLIKVLYSLCVMLSSLVVEEMLERVLIYDKALLLLTPRGELYHSSSHAYLVLYFFSTAVHINKCAKERPPTQEETAIKVLYLCFEAMLFMWSTHGKMALFVLQTLNCFAETFFHMA